MKRTWTLLERLLHPPKWVLLTLPPIVFAALTLVLLQEKDSMPAYIIYGMSAYMIYCLSANCLTIWILPLPRLFRKAKENMMHRLAGTVFGGKYIGDLAFRGSVSVYQGMMVNFFYVVFRGPDRRDYAVAQPKNERGEVR